MEAAEMARKKKAAKKKRKVMKKAKRAAKKVAKKSKKVAKKARRKVSKKKVARGRKPAAKKRVGKPASAAAGIKPVILPAAQPVALPNEERVGVITHYYSHLGVAVLQLDAGAMLHEGDTIHVKGHTSDFVQQVGSMEIEHQHVSEARPGQSFGLKVKEHAREHDIVYRVKAF
jgi:hypothetical protein